MLARALVLALVLLASDPVLAQELSAFRGALSGVPLSARSYFGWMLEYLQPLRANLAWSFSALDEGHFNGHHRDGYDVQLWGRTELLSPRVTLAVGAGPYQTLDTLETGNQGGYVDQHGWAMLYSGACSWRVTDHWLVAARVNRVEARSGVDSTAYPLGLGYRFDNDATTAAGTARFGDRRDQLAVMIGGTKNNSVNDESAFSWSIEYRHVSGHDLNWTASFISSRHQPCQARHRRGGRVHAWRERIHQRERDRRWRQRQVLRRLSRSQARAVARCRQGTVGSGCASSAGHEDPVSVGSR